MNIIIVGAGYSGILCAKQLEQRFRKNDDINITIIDKNPYHTMLTELHEVAAGRIEKAAVKMELNKIFAQRKVTVVCDEIKKIDQTKKVIVGKDETYAYDYLVIATGSKPTSFNIKGFEYAYQLHSYEDAIELNNQIIKCFEQARYTKDESERRSLLSFSIIGSGFTGLEMVGELGEYKKDLANRFKLDSNEITINIIDVIPRILPHYPDKLVQKVEHRLTKLGITMIMNQAVVEIGKNYLVLDNEKILSHTIIWTAGIEGNNPLSNLKQTEKKRYQTNSYLQALDDESIFIVGDNLAYTPSNSQQSVPQMIENAEKSAKCVSTNIINLLTKQTLVEYQPSFHGSMISIGSRWGVAYVGLSAKKLRAYSGFRAMFIKHFINLIYFMKVLGIHQCYNYLKHEIFTVKNNRSLVGGHFSNQKNAPTIFLVPLRIFLGITWLANGLAKLPNLLRDWTDVTVIPNYATRFEIAGSLATTKPFSSTSPLDEFGQTLTDLFELKAVKITPTFGFFDGIVNWFYKTFFWIGDTGFSTFAALCQSGMIFTQIAIGIMFILGFLTPVASIISFLMMIVIYLSGWSYMSIFFYGLAGLACFFAGNSLGLDYYFLPWLDKKLSTWRFTKKWYLYFK